MSPNPSFTRLPPPELTCIQQQQGHRERWAKRAPERRAGLLSTPLQGSFLPWVSQHTGAKRCPALSDHSTRSPCALGVPHSGRERHPSAWGNHKHPRPKPTMAPCVSRLRHSWVSGCACRCNVLRVNNPQIVPTSTPSFPSRPEPKL